MIVNGPYKYLTILESYINRKKNRTYICLCKCGRKRKFTEKCLNKLPNRNKCKCPKNLGSHSKNYKGYQDISGHYFSRLKLSAKNRKIEFKLDIKEIWDIYEKQNKLCALTKLPIEFNPRNGKSLIAQTASVDRIDSNKPYEKSNIQIVHVKVNSIKHSYNEQLVKYLCKKVAIHNG